MKNALILSGGWQGHEPEKCAEVFANFLRERDFKVTISGNLDSLLDLDFLQQQQVIIPNWTMGKISSEQSHNLCKAIKEGAGLAGWHGGMCDAFREDTEYQFMCGGQWVAHPGGVIKYRVNIKQDSAGFMAGLESFELESEQYYMHTDPGNEVLATTNFSGKEGEAGWIAGTVMPVVWKRRYGMGRVFYSSLGHIATDFTVTQVKEIMCRGLIWAAGE